ncbi:MAG: AfsR/SARP family transcriptional regulator [Solirubrobacteraceae bacterium]
MIVVAAMLSVLRPGLPQLPDSLTGPVTVEQLEDVLAFLGWLALILLLALAAIRLAHTNGGTQAATTIADPRPGQVANPKPRSRDRARIGLAPALTVAAPPDEQHATHPARTAIDLAETSAAAATVGSRLRISLLGSFTVENVDGPVRGLRSSTEQLLAYLALHPRGATRDELVEAIWPGQDPRRTRPRLWQSTSEARKLLGDAFISHRGHYALDRRKITVDGDGLEALLAEAKATTTPASERRVLERGLGLLRGEPLAGWDHVWADTDTGRLRATQAELLEQLGRARLATGDAHGALEAAEQGLDRDSLNEALWRLAMQAETKLGLRESVGRRYQRLRTLLDEQLGLEPETATRTLYRELLGQR